MLMFTLKLGMPVFCRDDYCGTLARLVIEPQLLEITHLVVEKGVLLRQARIVPVEVLQAADADYGLLLNLDSANLADFPRYRDATPERPEFDDAEHIRFADDEDLVTATGLFASPDEVYVTVPVDLAVVRSGTRVRDDDGPVGTLSHFLIEAGTYTLSYLGVRTGLAGRREVLIPAHAMERVDQDEIFVDSVIPGEGVTSSDISGGAPSILTSLGEAELRLGSTLLQPDTQLADFLRELLLATPGLEKELIDVRCDRGTVHLDGNVSSPQAREMAEAVIRAYNGEVRSIVNGLHIAT